MNIKPIESFEVVDPKVGAGEVCKTSEVRQLEQEHAKLLKIIRDWPVEDIMVQLIKAADILLHDKDYDGHGWEVMQRAMEKGYDNLPDIMKPKLKFYPKQLKAKGE